MKEIINRYNATFFLSLALISVSVPFAANMSTVLLILSALGAYNLSLTNQCIKVEAKKLCFTAIILMATYSLISAIWSPYPEKAISNAARVALLLFAGLLVKSKVSLMSEKETKFAKNILIISSMVVWLFYIEELAFSFPIVSIIKKSSNLYDDYWNKLGKGASFLCLYIWPVSYMIYTKTSKKIYPILFILINLIFSHLLPMAAVELAILSGIFVFALTRLFGRKFLAILFPLIITTILMFPLISLKIISPNAINNSSYAEKVPPSWYHRLVIWNFSSSKAMENPLIGSGSGASRYISDNLQPEKIMTLPDGTDFMGYKLPLHTHNSSIQVWLEMGFVGIMLYIMLIIGIARRISLSTDRNIMAVYTATLTSTMCISMISFGIWQSWWIATMLLANILCQLSSMHNKEHDIKNL